MGGIYGVDTYGVGVYGGLGVMPSVPAEGWLYPGSSTYPGSAVYPLQPRPLIQGLLSFDAVSVANPNWIYMGELRLRSFSTDRGRESELQAMDAGTAAVVLGNRDRALDPTNAASPYYPNVRPLNRIWLREQFAGETQDLFKGYVESYEQSWPGWGGSDAEVALSCVDEFKVLSLDALPTTSPPRNSYEDLVQSDNPSGYWRLNQDPAQFVQSPVDSSTSEDVPGESVAPPPGPSRLPRHWADV